MKKATRQSAPWRRALKSVGREHLKRFFEAELYAITHRTVEQIISYAGVIESWLLGEIDRTPEELIAFTDQVLQDYIRGARIRWQRQAEESAK